MIWHPKQRKVWVNHSVLIPTECLAALLPAWLFWKVLWWQIIFFNFDKLLTKLFPCRVEAPAASEQAEHLELSERSRACHAAQCLNARQQKHHSQRWCGVSAQLAGSGAIKERRVWLPRATGDDAGHKEREAGLQGESTERSWVLVWWLWVFKVSQTWNSQKINRAWGMLALNA